MSGRRWLVGLMVVSALVSGCGATVGKAIPGYSDQVSAPASLAGTVGFLYVDSATVLYLQWPTDDNGLVVGTVENDSVVGSTPEEDVSVNHDNLTGHIDTTGAVSLQSAALSSTTVFGTSTADRLVLNLPEQSGGLQAVVFRAAPPSNSTRPWPPCNPRSATRISTPNSRQASTATRPH